MWKPGKSIIDRKLELLIKFLQQNYQPKEDFDRQLDIVIDNINAMSDMEICIELQNIIVSVGDAHSIDIDNIDNEDKENIMSLQKLGMVVDDEINEYAGVELKEILLIIQVEVYI